MFDNLVESSTHTQDIQRKGGFFLGTVAVYFIVLSAVVIGSIYYVDANLAAQNLELTTLVAPVPMQQQVAPEPPPDQPKQVVTKDQPQVTLRTELIANTNDPTKVSREISSTASNIPPAPPGAVKSNRNFDPVVGGAPSPGTGAPGGVPGGSGAPPPPPPPDPPKPDPTPVKKPPTQSGGVLNGKATSKVVPPYPAAAKTARISGAVNVQVTIDESGRVISASAVSGPAILRQAAEQAARGWRFAPTTLSGQPVKVTGVIIFNFTPPQ